MDYVLCIMTLCSCGVEVNLCRCGCLFINVFVIFFYTLDMKKAGVGEGCGHSIVLIQKLHSPGKYLFILSTTTYKTLLLDFFLYARYEEGRGRVSQSIVLLQKLHPQGKYVFLSSITNTTLLLDFFFVR